MTPSHALFRCLFAVGQSKVATYDYLPEAGVSYPFLYVGESTATEGVNKELLGTIRQTVHLYGLREQRTLLDDLSDYLENQARFIQDGYDYHLIYGNCSKQTIQDYTDVQPLIHIVLDFSFTYTKKGA